MSPDTGPLSGPISVSMAEFPARAPQRLKVSFEFSPPKTEAAERTLWETVTRLAPLRPTFVSVTYGAGGSTRERTHETVARLMKETGVDPGRAPHLRRRDPRRDRRDRARPIGMPASATSSRCAAIRRRHGRQVHAPIPAAMPMPPSWSPA